eukprot:m.42330 g.42330  ORF g.42330 m.42330 type:complete len:93 (-) comp15020_c0_seq8:812-1090(-)
MLQKACALERTVRCSYVITRQKHRAELTDKVEPAVLPNGPEKRHHEIVLTLRSFTLQSRSQNRSDACVYALIANAGCSVAAVFFTRGAGVGC